MTISSNIQDKSMVVSEAQRLLKESDSATASYDPLLGFLRAHHFNRLESMRFLVESAPMRLADAKRIIYESSVWRDLHQKDMELQTSLVNSLELLGREDR